MRHSFPTRRSSDLNPQVINVSGPPTGHPPPYQSAKSVPTLCGAPSRYGRPQAHHLFRRSSAINNRHQTVSRMSSDFRPLAGKVDTRRHCHLSNGRLSRSTRHSHIPYHWAHTPPFSRQIAMPEKEARGSRRPKMVPFRVGAWPGQPVFDRFAICSQL